MKLTYTCPRCECGTYDGPPEHCGVCGFVAQEGFCYFCCVTHVNRVPVSDAQATADVAALAPADTGHLPGCASQSFPDPGICFCDERMAEGPE